MPGEGGGAATLSRIGGQGLGLKIVENLDQSWDYVQSSEKRTNDSPFHLNTSIRPHRHRRNSPHDSIAAH